MDIQKTQQPTHPTPQRPSQKGPQKTSAPPATKSLDRPLFARPDLYFKSTRTAGLFRTLPLLLMPALLALWNPQIAFFLAAGLLAGALLHLGLLFCYWVFEHSTSQPRHSDFRVQRERTAVNQDLQKLLAIEESVTFDAHRFAQKEIHLHIRELKDSTCQIDVVTRPRFALARFEALTTITFCATSGFVAELYLDGLYFSSIAFCLGLMSFLHLRKS